MIGRDVIMNKKFKAIKLVNMLINRKNLPSSEKKFSIV